MESEPESVHRSSNEVLLHFPFVGGKAVEQASAGVDFFLSKRSAVDVQFGKMDKMQLLCLQQSQSSGHNQVVSVNACGHD